MYILIKSINDQYISDDLVKPSPVEPDLAELDLAKCDTADPICKAPFDYNWVWVNSVYDSGEYLKPNNAGDFELSFDDSKVYIKTDCNKIFGSYTLDQNTLTFSSLGMTKMHCTGSKDSEFASVLESVKNFSVTPDGRLLLYFESEGGKGISIFTSTLVD